MAKDDNHKFDKAVEDRLIANIINSDLTQSQANQEESDDEFESFMDMMNGERVEKEYDWQSDVNIPEFAIHMLTQASIDAGVMFQQRAFTEVYLEDEGEEAKLNAEATKELINRTLNQRHLYHYHKYMRAKGTTTVAGRCYAHCWWEQESRTENVKVGTTTEFQQLDVDIEGQPVTDPTIQTPAVGEVEVGEFDDVEFITKDRFNYEIVDQRNFFTDNTYTYSLQQKPWMLVRVERTLDELKKEAKRAGYFNLDLLKDSEDTHSTEMAQDTSNLDDNETRATTDVHKPFDIYIRYGKHWIMPSGKPGIDKDGKVRDTAVFAEVVMVFAKKATSTVLIAFHKTPYIDAMGNPFKPVIRGLCYINLTEDGGVGDGLYSRELQIGINDTFNVSNDRVMLATMPTFKIKRNTMDDNPDIYWEPGHAIPLSETDDLVEMKLDDDITGAITQIGMLTGKMQQVTATFPPTMGDVAPLTSTTATAVAGAEQHQNIRTNYKGLTFENTFLAGDGLYWMISQMTWAFAKPETGEKLMGKKVVDFDPTKDYYYKPVSQAIESEYSKSNKVKMWIQMFGYVSNIQHPDIVKMVNFIITEIAKLMGDEFVNFSSALLNPQQPITQGGPSQADGVGGGATNETGLPQTLPEQGVRDAANV